MPKHLKTILMYEDVNDFSLEREPDIDLEGTIKASHLKKMADGLINSGYHNPDTSPAEKHQIYIRHLNNLEQDSEVLIGGVDSREKKLKKLLDDHYASRGMGNFKIKHHAQQIISPQKLEEIGNNIKNGNGTVRSHADVQGVTRRHLAELLRKKLDIRGAQQRPPHPPEVIKTVKDALTHESGNIIPSLSNAKAREISDLVREKHNGYEFPTNSIRRIHFGLKNQGSNG